jgi:hypothetical protein
VERIETSGVRFGGVDHRFCSSRAAQVSPVSGALDRSDRCERFVGFVSGELLNLLVFGLCCCWSVLGQFGVVLLGFV